MDSTVWASAATGTTLDELRDRYAYPEDVVSPYVRANFVTSIDGAVTVDGSSTGLGTPADRKVFGLLRELADVILVGAGTVRAEDYGGARTNEARRTWRSENGLAAVPPVAVVTGTADIDPSSRLLTDTSVPALILTSRVAPEDNKQRLAEAGATVLEIGDDVVTPVQVLHTLETHGLNRVLCEGGPTLFGTLVAADLVDELCLTTAPFLVGGGASRPAVSPLAVRRRMSLQHMMADEDGTVLSRWVRPRESGRL